jgi:TRAP-type C4-dicarboxylate transport system permease small subunit
VLITAVFICLWSYDLIAWAVQKKTALPATRIPSWVPQSAFLSSTVLFVFYFLRDALKDAIGLIEVFKNGAAPRPEV